MAAQTPDLLLLLSLLVFAPPWTAAESSDTQAHLTLRGLQGVGVVIERLDAEAEQAGLTRAQLQAVVEERLQQASIPVLAGDIWMQAPGLPYLYVRVGTRKTPDHFYAIVIQVELWHAVVLLHDPTLTTMAPTWKRHGILGRIGHDSIRTVREMVGNDVDAFIRDYLAMHARAEESDVQCHSPQNAGTDR